MSDNLQRTERLGGMVATQATILVCIFNKSLFVCSMVHIGGVYAFT